MNKSKRNNNKKICSHRGTSLVNYVLNNMGYSLSGGATDGTMNGGKASANRENKNLCNNIDIWSASKNES